MPQQLAYQQKRQTVAGSVSAVSDGSYDDFHQELKITHDKDGLTGESTIYNVAHDTWKQIKQADPYRLSLGYRGSPFATCLFGTIQEKHPPERIGADTAYTIKGRDESGAVLRSTFRSHTWENATINQVARDMAGFAGLSVGLIDAPGGSLGRKWPIMKEHSMRYWMDQLLKEANDFGGEQYEAFARAGKLYFKPKQTAQEQAITLRDGKRGNVEKIDAAEGKDTKSGGGDAVQFSALLDPRIQKDGFAQVSTEDYSGTYRVAEYELRSSTETGEHLMSGKLTPTSAKYKVVNKAPPVVTAANAGGTIQRV